MDNAFVLRLVTNAAWQTPLCGLVALALDAMLLRRWPGSWRVAVWRVAVLAGAAIPLAMTIWNPTPQVTAGFVLPAVNAAGTGAGRGWSAIPSVGWLYLLAVGFSAARLLWRWRQLRYLNAETAAVPVTFGVRKAVVVLPSRFLREATALAREAASAHEAVHVEQRDYLHLLLAELATLPVAMHPAMTWMKARLRNAVEIRCDERAAAKFADRRDYAQGLIDAARVLSGGQGPALAPGFWSSNTFEERMMNLMTVKQMPGRKARLAAAGAMLLAGIAVVSVSTRYATAAPPQQQKEGKTYAYKVGQNGVSAPRVLHKVEPEYSESARDAKVSGNVTLRVEVTPEGKAENFQIVKSLEPTLDQAAIDAVKQWTFEPAKKDGTPVRVTATIEVNFRLK